MVQYRNLQAASSRGEKAGATVGMRVLPKGNQRALWAQKELT